MKVSFTTQKVEIRKDSSLYLMSDGFMDQFGGPENKKFNQNRFEDLLKEISSLPMAEQKEKMSQSFEEWKGDRSQIDDVIVLGLTLN